MLYFYIAKLRNLKTQFFFCFFCNRDTSFTHKTQINTKGVIWNEELLVLNIIETEIPMTEEEIMKYEMKRRDSYVSVHIEMQDDNDNNNSNYHHHHHQPQRTKQQKEIEMYDADSCGFNKEYFKIYPCQWNDNELLLVVLNWNTINHKSQNRLIYLLNTHMNTVPFHPGILNVYGYTGIEDNSLVKAGNHANIGHKNR